MAHQQGSIYENETNRTWYLKYRITEGANRVHKTERLCCRNGSFHHRLCTHRSEHRSKKSLEHVRDKFMQGVNTQQYSGRNAQQDMRIVDFWETHYVPYCEEVLPLTGKSRRRASTMRSYRQVWNQHLKPHFGAKMLREYTSQMGTRLLRSLTSTQSRGTLKHVRVLASSVFALAVAEEILTLNPWIGVKIPDDAIESCETLHYTLEEAENLISALVTHVDCQLVLSLCCFLGLRPSEVAALRWEDFDADSIHIRRAVVRGHVDEPKTPESVATLPLINQVHVPLKLWHRQCGGPTEGWVFKSRNDTPVDLHNVVNRIIIPHVTGEGRCVPCDGVPKKSKVEWKGLYAGRRGAATAVIGLTNGNYAAAQELLRHKSMDTTLKFYKKKTQSALSDGLKAVQKALTTGK
jgi:integrase